MSTINTVLSRMMSEPAFADAVFADVEKALAEYNLSTDELAKFKDISRADFDAFASASPEERKSFGLNNQLWGDYFYVDDYGDR